PPETTQGLVLCVTGNVPPAPVTVQVVPLPGWTYNPFAAAISAPPWTSCCCGAQLAPDPAEASIFTVEPVPSFMAIGLEHAAQEAGAPRTPKATARASFANVCFI